MTLTELAQPTLPADALVADRTGAVVVDLADTEFIDTGSIRAVARAAEFLSDRGRGLTLRSPSPRAVRILTILGLSHLIEPVKATEQ